MTQSIVAAAGAIEGHAPDTVRVLIVDDSTVYRHALREAINAAPGFEVVSTAGNGRLALPRLRYYRPHVVILDQEMPEMSGLETLDFIHREYPDTVVLMFSAHTTEGARITIEALQRGAHDFVAKPEGLSPSGVHDFVEAKLLRRMRALLDRRRSGDAPSSRPAAPAAPAWNGFRPDICAIAASTGGPVALREMLAAVPHRFSGVIVIVQHMPPIFTRDLAASLSRYTGHRVVEAEDGQRAESGVCYIAPGGRHLRVEGVASNLALRLSDDPPEQSCRPSANVLFRSLARPPLRGRTLSVVLTGMGEDGMLGVRELLKEGGRCITQNQESCVVYGMPQVVFENGLSSEVGSPAQLGARVGALLGVSM